MTQYGTLWNRPRNIQLHADPTRLVQVLANLLASAAKCTPCGGRIEVAAFRDGAGVYVTVADKAVNYEALTAVIGASELN